MDKLLPCPLCGSLASDMGGDHCCCSNDDCALSDMGNFMSIHRDEWNTRHTPEGWSMVPSEATRAQESKAEDYWQSKRFAAFSDDPRTWAGVYQAMLAASPKWGGG